MSFFSIGKNEIKELEKQKKQLEARIESNKTVYGGNVCSFNEIVLKNQKNILSNKISLMKHMNPDSYDDDDGIA